MAMAAFSSPLAYRMRDELGYSLILTHIGYDQDVNDKIKSHVANVLIGTPTVAAVTAANAAIAAAKQKQSNAGTLQFVWKLPQASAYLCFLLELWT